MKKVHKTINKNIRMLLIVAAVTAVALGVLLLLISGNEERNNIPTDPTEALESEETTQPDISETTIQTEEGVSEEAQALFNAKIESIGDPAGVAKLLETIDLEARVASYKVQIEDKKEPKIMLITFDKTIDEASRSAFDEQMQKYAEQILALVTDAGQVQWVYKVTGEDKKTQEVTVSLKAEEAAKLLQGDVKKYGASAKKVQLLLNEQKGTRR